MSSIEREDSFKVSSGIDAFHALAVDREFSELIAVKKDKVFSASVDPMLDEVFFYSKLSINAENPFKSGDFNSKNSKDDVAIPSETFDCYYLQSKIEKWLNSTM